MNRVIAAARLQLVAWPHLLGFPWLILGLSFAANVALFGAIGVDTEAEATTGGLAAIYVVFFVTCVTSMTQVFSFAVGFGLTRRAFYVAMSLLVVIHSILYALALGLLAVVESTTGGWGVGVEFFRPSFIAVDGVFAQLAVYAVPFMLLAFSAMCMGVVYKRWGVTGVYTVGAILVAVQGAAIALVTARHLWGDIGDWLSAQSTTALVAGWPIPVTVALALAGYAGIRRAVP